MSVKDKLNVDYFCIDEYLKSHKESDLAKKAKKEKKEKKKNKSDKLEVVVSFGQEK